MSQELHFAVSQFLYRKAELCDAMKVGLSRVI